MICLSTDSTKSHTSLVPGPFSSILRAASVAHGALFSLLVVSFIKSGTHDSSSPRGTRNNPTVLNSSNNAHISSFRSTGTPSTPFDFSERSGLSLFKSSLICETLSTTCLRSQVLAPSSNSLSSLIAASRDNSGSRVCISCTKLSLRAERSVLVESVAPRSLSDIE